MSKKYELTTNTKEWMGRTLYQIKAVREFDLVEEGQLGGWIEKETNLDQYGNARVSGDARVSKRREVIERVHASDRLCTIAVGR